MCSIPSHSSILSQIALLVMGALLTLLGSILTPLIERAKRWWFGPKLQLDFRKGDKDDEYRPLTPDREEGSELKAYYVRIKVTNEKSAIAKGCRAYLIGVEKLSNSGVFEPTVPLYCDSLPVAWSHRGADALDLPKGVVQFVDVISTRNNCQNFQPEIKVGKTGPFRYETVWKQRGTFRFTIQISGENFDPVSRNIIFLWDGIWDQFQTEPG